MRLLEFIFGMESEPTMSKEQDGSWPSWRRTIGLAALVGGLLWLKPDRLHAQSSLDRFRAEPLLTLFPPGHTGEVRALQFAEGNGGTQLLSAGLDKVVHVWDLNPANPPLIRTLRPPRWRGLAGAIYTMALSPVELPGDPGQRLLLTAGYGVDAKGGSAVLFRYPGGDAPTGEIVGRLLSGDEALNRLGHDNAIVASVFSPDGRRLATGSLDGSIILWEVNAIAPEDRDRPRALKRIWLADANRGNADAAASGPTRTPTCLVFTPDGSLLIASDSLGGLTVWDSQNGTQRVSTKLGEARVNDLAIAPDGRDLLAASADGRLTRVTLPNLDGLTPLNLDGQADRAGNVRSNPGRELFAVAFAPGGKRFAVARLAHPFVQRDRLPDLTTVVELRTWPEGRLETILRQVPGRVACLAFSPDGSALALGGGEGHRVEWHPLATPPADPAGLAPASRQFGSGGDPIRRLAFLDPNRLVWSNGHAVTPTNPARGFDLARRQPYELNANLAVEQFCAIQTALRLDVITALGDLRRLAFAAAALRALETDPGQPARADNLLLTPLDPQRVEIRRIDAPAQAPRSLTLDPNREGRWWCLALTPARPPRPPLAWIGTDAGVLVYRLDPAHLRDPVLVRFLAAHEGPVLSLAFSPDGRWLATGSSDQTIRLHSLAGLDFTRPPGLGATFQVRDDRRVILTALQPEGFANRAGLRVGDVIDQAFIGRDQFGPVARFPNRPTRDLSLFPALAEAEIPNRVAIQLLVRRRQTLLFGWTLDRGNLGFSITKRDNADLALYRDSTDWVVWTPQGLYDTSIEGDSRIGWHINRFFVEDSARRPTDAFALRELESTYRNPAWLDTLWQTGRIPPPPARAPAPPPIRPVVRVEGPPLDRLVTAASLSTPLPNPPNRLLALNVAIESLAAGPAPARLRVRLDRAVSRLEPIPAGGDVVRLAFNNLPIDPGSHLLDLTVLDLDNQPLAVRQYPFQTQAEAPPESSPTPARPARFHFAALGGATFQAALRLPTIVQSPRDLRVFQNVAAHAWIDPSTLEPWGQRIPPPAVSDQATDLDDPEDPDGDPSTTHADSPIFLSSNVVEFVEILRQKETFLQADDTLVIALQTHGLQTRPGSNQLDDLLDPQGGRVSRDELVSSLGGVVEKGVRVIVIADLLHVEADLARTYPGRDKPAYDLTELGRRLQNQGVLVLCASVRGPSQHDGRVGYFARALADTTGDTLDQPLTLFQYERRVREEVERRTDQSRLGRQRVRFLLPPISANRHFDRNHPFFRPVGTTGP